MGTQRPPIDLIAVLEERGFRATAPRKAVAKLLEKKQRGFTVEALSEELPSIGKATIYRTIKLFLKEGVVCKFHLMDGSPLYCLTRVGHRHYHSICIQCGDVAEFKAARIEKLLQEACTDIPGQIVDHRIEVYVNCQYCPIKMDQSVDCSSPLESRCNGTLHNSSFP